MLPLTIELFRSNPAPLYHQLAEQLRMAVTRGLIEPDETLEYESHLAARLRISRNTVRRAYSILLHEGYFWIDSDTELRASTRYSSSSRTSHE